MKRPTRSRTTAGLIAVSLTAAGLWTSSAWASFVPTSTGTELLASDSYLAEPGSTSSAPVFSTTQPGSDYLLAVPGQYTFNNVFTSAQSDVLGTDATAGNYAFQDSYVFQVAAGASGDTVVATLNLPNSFGMSDLQMRLYQITSGTSMPVVGQSLSGPPVVSIVSPWVGTMGPDTQQIQAAFSGLTTAGTYVLDIAGTATGSHGGEYIGALALQPVPLPASTWFLLIGAGAALWTVRRRDKVD